MRRNCIIKPNIDNIENNFYNIIKNMKRDNCKLLNSYLYFDINNILEQLTIK